MKKRRFYNGIRLKDSFFADLRIRKLRKLAGGDTYTIIYLKMLLLAMKNDGVITYTGIESSFARELALELDEEVENIKATTAFLIGCGIAENIDETHIFIYE